MVKIVVIGYGNTLNGDDGVGHVIAQRLKLNLSHKNLAIYRYQQLMPEIVEKIKSADLVLFFDAGLNGIPGSVSIAPVKADPNYSPFNHYFSPATLAKYSQSLYDVEPLMYLISITGESFSLQEQLSNAVMITVKTILYKLTDILETILQLPKIDHIDISKYLDTLKHISL